MINGSVIFGTIDSWTDWGLVLAQKAIGLPAVKTQQVDIPCADGVLDLTERLVGRPCYGNRTITIQFLTTDELSGEDWAGLLSKVSEALHGKTMDIKFSEDPDWYYTGRCAIDSFETSNAKRTITISCNCAPYKTSAADNTTKFL